ncbi:hypothetical protein PUR23_26695 [Methylorubrum populi]
MPELDGEDIEILEHPELALHRPLGLRAGLRELADLRVRRAGVPVRVVGQHHGNELRHAVGDVLFHDPVDRFD